MTKNMELWDKTFQRIIREKKPQHRWTLELKSDLEVDRVKQGWRQYKHQGLARFQCSLCGRSWVSAQVLILFHMCLRKPYGRVKMRVFAQRCQKCSTALFEEPEFSREGVESVLGGLVVQILLKCYQERVQQGGDLGAPREDPFRAGLLTGPHDAENCEACLLGRFCPSRSDAEVSTPHRTLTRSLSHSTQDQLPACRKRKLLLLVSLCLIMIIFVVLMVTLSVTGLL
ncbi:receptor-transporting protein 3-like [Dromiciops gliroides]|uniref:receptor-transporting protein 3-like n=1 Tax=Dromiciops gliroides TaxID=33562 RepID=UPI001CC68338|nr:receptor-transporting protein 3-like [Dromiciops gliroides]